ncbi:hypothetical protein B5S31_g1722 [[Candida] boidinii]|nr:hypothetical protein B5S31_g1722 [[Candida] boidinii]
MQNLDFIITILVTVLLLVLTSIWFNRKTLFGDKDLKTPFYLILGPQSSGKTVLFEILKNNNEDIDIFKLPIDTVTSQEPNYLNDFKLPSDKDNKKNLGIFKLIDFPSNSKLKNLYLYPFLKSKINDKTLKNCRGIIYIIDSSNFTNDYSNSIAKDLIELFKFTESLPGGIDICLFCNKSDLFTSKKSLKIKELLSIEIQKCWELNTKSLNKVKNGETTGSSISNSSGSSSGIRSPSDINNNSVDDDDENDFLNNVSSNGKFDFDLLDGNVDFIEGNMFKNKLQNVYNWIDERGVNFTM